MMDDDKKTVLLPRFANMASYHTVVMEKPPEMTVGLTGGCQTVPRAPRMPKPLQATHLAPAISAKEDPLRTRMAKVQVAQMPPPPRAPAPPPPPPPQKSGTMKTKPARNPQDRKQLVRKIAIFGGAAIVLSVSLLLPLSGGPGDSQAASIPAPATTQEAMSAPPPSVAQEAPSATPAEVLAPPNSSITEERAAVLLLQGRQREALTMYRELASSSKRSPGIEAMVRVLSQKVESE